MSGPDIDSDVEERLVRLETESDARRRELSDVMQQLPAEVSRRDVIRDSVADLRSGSVATLGRRVVQAVVALPRRLAERVRTSLRRR